MSEGKTEQFLLLRIRAFKDKNAFAVLLKGHSSGLLRFLLSKLPRKEDAEDLYSIVSLKLWEYSTSTEVAHFSGLAFTIARRAIADFYKAHEKAQIVSLETDEGEIPVASKQSGEQIQSSIDGQFLFKALDTLSPDERDAIVMRHIEGYSINEIASHLEKNVSATSVLIHRAMKKLKDHYDRP